METEGGYPIPLIGGVNLNVNYEDKTDEAATVSWLVGGAIGGAAIGGPAGAVAGFLTSLIGTVGTDLAKGNASLSVSVLGVEI